MLHFGLLLAVSLSSEPGFSTPLTVAASNTGQHVAFKWGELYMVTEGRSAPIKLEGGNGAGSFKFTRDGKQLIASMGGGGFAIWDAISGAQTMRVKSSTVGWGVAISPQGDRVAVGSDRRKIEIFDVKTRQLQFVTQKDSETKEYFRGIARDSEGNQHTHASFDYSIDRLSFSPDGTMLASRGMDGTFIRIWDAQTGSLISEIKDKTRSVLGWSRDSKLIYDLRGVRAWNPRTAESEFFAEIGSNVFGSLEPGMSGETVVATGEIGALSHSGKVWRIYHGSKEAHTKVQMRDWNPADANALSDNATFVAAVDQKKTIVRLWDASSGELKWSFTLP